LVIGRILDQCNKELNPLRYDPASIFEHIAVWGATGVGKSTAIKNLVIGLVNEINFAIIDWHDEYREIIPLLKKEGEDILVLNPLLKKFSLNPLELRETSIDRDIAVAERIEDFISLLKQVYILGEIQESRVRDALYEIYARDLPTIGDLVFKLSGKKSDNLVSKLKKGEHPLSHRTAIRLIAM
jgi:DNA helicase HerA-like ATPase